MLFRSVVKRLSHSSHTRRRRIELLSSAGLESITLVFSWPQNGHFISFPPFSDSASKVLATPLGQRLFPDCPFRAAPSNLRFEARFARQIEKYTAAYASMAAIHFSIWLCPFRTLYVYLKIMSTILWPFGHNWMRLKEKNGKPLKKRHFQVVISKNGGVLPW